MRRALAAGALAVLLAVRDAHAQRPGFIVSGVAGSTGSALLIQGVDEEGTGIWYGAQVAARFGRVMLEGTGMKGKLAPTSGTAGLERDGGEMRAVAGLRVFRWLALEGSYDTRAFDSPAGYQKWTMTGAGGRLSSQLGVPSLQGWVRVHYLFGATVTGQPTPDQAMAFEGGLDVTSISVPAIAIGVFYRLERFDFPNGDRVEQYDVLGVRFGFALGR